MVFRLKVRRLVIANRTITPNRVFVVHEGHHELVDVLYEKLKTWPLVTLVGGAVMNVPVHVNDVTLTPKVTLQEIPS